MQATVSLALAAGRAYGIKDQCFSHGVFALNLGMKVRMDQGLWGWAFEGQYRKIVRSLLRPSSVTFFHD